MEDSNKMDKNRKAYFWFQPIDTRSSDSCDVIDVVIKYFDEETGRYNYIDGSNSKKNFEVLWRAGNKYLGKLYELQQEIRKEFEPLLTTEDGEKASLEYRDEIEDKYERKPGNWPEMVE